MTRQHIIQITIFFLLAVAVHAQRATNLPPQQEEEDRRAFYARQIDTFIRIQKGGSDLPKRTLDPFESDRKKLIKSLTRPTDLEDNSYSQLFKQTGGGVFTFLNPSSCKETSKDPLLIKYLGTNCLSQMLPGAGAHFSFRKGAYTYPRYSDLSLSKDVFVSSGIVTHTILTDMLDVRLSDVRLTDPELDYLVNFSPALTVNDLEKKEKELESGISRNGRTFSSSIRAVPGHTYLLRSIAYAGKLLVVYDLGKSKLRLDLIEDDERGDVTIVFRYVMNPEGEPRIIWLKLRQSRSPRISFPEIAVDNPSVTTKITRIQ